MLSNVRNRKMYWVAAVIILSAIGAVGLKLHYHNASGTDVSRDELRGWMDRNVDVCILDVRSAKEYKSGCIAKRTRFPFANNY